MSLTNKVLYDIDQRNDTTPTQKETARKNIGAYEDKTAAGGIPKADLASDVQSSLGKADSSVQSVTSNGQALTKSAAGAIDIPKATDTKWGVVQVVNELKDNQNVIPNSRVIKEAVDGLSAALQARATFWTDGRHSLHCQVTRLRSTMLDLRALEKTSMTCTSGKHNREAMFSRMNRPSLSTGTGTAHLTSLVKTLLRLS